MKVLVTGASGLLGHAIAHRLANSGDEVRVLLRKPSLQAELFEETPIQWFPGALEYPNTLRRVAQGVDEIYHCAAASTDWAPWHTYCSANVTGVENLLSAALNCAPNLKRFLHLSTTDVYGYPKKVCDEQTAMKEVGLPYNRTKIAGERLVQEAQEKGMPTTIIRPATIYGPRDNDFVSEVYHQLKQNNMPLIGGGKSSPGLLFIDNAVDGIIAAARSQDTIGKAYNLRDESTETWEEYLHAFADHAGLERTKLRLPRWFAWSMACSLECFHKFFRPSVRPLLTRHTVHLMTRDADFPIERAKSDFGFKSRVSFQEGVARSVDWAQSQAEEKRGMAILGRTTNVH